jgi:hypothetical protein
MATMRAAKHVVVRTYSAGVHFGQLVSREGKEVVLKNARRLWSWKGAYTLNEIACSGVSEGSRVSAPVPSIVVTEAIEILECTTEGAKNLEAAKWAS